MSRLVRYALGKLTQVNNKGGVDEESYKMDAVGKLGDDSLGGVGHGSNCCGGPWFAGISGWPLGAGFARGWQCPAARDSAGNDYFELEPCARASGRPLRRFVR